MTKTRRISIITILIMTIFTTCILSSCEKEENLQAIINQIDLPSEINDELDLPNQINNYEIIWSSSNEAIVANNGQITRTNNDQIVELTAHLKVDSAVKKTFSITIKGYTDLEIITKVYETLSLPTTLVSDIEFPTQQEGVNLSWQSTNPDVLTNQGIIKKGMTDVEVVVQLELSKNDQKVVKELTFVIKALSNEEIINLALDSIVMTSQTYEDLSLPTSVGDVQLSWNSSRKAVLSNTGIVNRTENDATVVLTVTGTYQGINIKKEFDVIVKGWTPNEKLTMALDNITFPKELTTDLVLANQYLYQTQASWKSLNESVLTNTGLYTYISDVATVQLELTLSLEGVSMNKTFTFNLSPKSVQTKEHLVIQRSGDLDRSKFNNLQIKDSRLQLVENAVEGTYESVIIETMKFTDLVASWASTSSTVATVELLVKARVNGIWSDYVSYQPWGLGLENKSIDKTNALIKISTDEIIVLNSKEADAIQYKLIIKRHTANEESPHLSLVSFALNKTGYSYSVNVSNLKTSTLYEVPKLNQNVVPTIGGSICSPTSTTMLLKYKGMNFSQEDQYEHRYIAYLARDYGSSIFGNWVFNTVTMGAFGYDAYVARFYSINELVEHLANVGPVAISVRGNMVSSEKNYTTNGHLITIIGYRYENNQLYLLSNDPNVGNVYCEYQESVIQNTWRGIVYVIE